jgi:hypothetical protein
MIPAPVGALPAGLGAVSPFVQDIVAIKGDNQDVDNPERP